MWNVVIDLCEQFCLFDNFKAKSNNNHTAGSTVASLVSSVTSFGATTAVLPPLAKTPRITMVSPQQEPDSSVSVRLWCDMCLWWDLPSPFLTSLVCEKSHPTLFYLTNYKKHTKLIDPEFQITIIPTLVCRVLILPIYIRSLTDRYYLYLSCQRWYQPVIVIVYRFDVQLHLFLYVHL